MRKLIFLLTIAACIIGISACSDKKSEATPADESNICPNVSSSCWDCINDKVLKGLPATAKGFTIPKDKPAYLTTHIGTQCSNICANSDIKAFNSCIKAKPTKLLQAHIRYNVVHMVQKATRKIADTRQTCEAKNHMRTIDKKCISFIDQHCQQQLSQLPKLVQNWHSQNQDVKKNVTAFIQKTITSCAKPQCSDKDIKNYIGGATCLSNAMLPKE